MVGVLLMRAHGFSDTGFLFWVLVWNRRLESGFEVKDLTPKP